MFATEMTCRPDAPTERLLVLDHGGVRFVEDMGDDLEVVNDAKVSFMKESTSFSPRDERILNFPAREGHSCYDAETEVFTARGWVRWLDVTEDDLLAAIIPTNDPQIRPQSAPAQSANKD